MTLMELAPAGTAEPGVTPRIRVADAGGLLAGLGLISVVIAVSAGPAPALLLLGTVVAGVLAVAAVLRPAIALVLLVTSEFGSISQVLAAHGVPALYKASLALGLVSALVALSSKEMRARLRPLPKTLPALLLVYLGTQVPAAIGSVSPQATSAFLADRLNDMVFFVVVLLLAHLVGRPWWLATAVVVPITVICLLIVINQVGFGGAQTFGGFATVSTASGELVTTPRYAGPLTDSNFWGRYLVLALPFGLALSHRALAARRRGPGAAWAGCALIILAGCYLTQSRGTLIAASAVVVLWVVASGPAVRRRALMLAPVAVLAMLVPGVGNRLLNLGEAFEDVPAYAIDPSLVERTAAQKIAVLIFTDHPLWGIGPGAFGPAVPAYASRSTELLIGATRAPHNLYLQLASESGVVGLAGWLVMIAGILLLGGRTVIRLAGHDPAGPGGAPSRSLAAAALASVAGWSLASIFLHLSYFRPVLAVFIVVAVLDTLTARMTAADDSGAATSAVSAHALRVALVRAGVAACIGLVVLAVVQVGFGVNRYTARAVYTIKPAVGTYESYSIDVRSRVTVMPAFAAAVQSTAAREDVRVDAEPTNGVITVTAVDGSAAAAATALRGAMSRVNDGVARLGLNRGFTLALLAPPEVTVQKVYPGRVVGEGVGVGVVLSAVVVGGLEWWRGRRRRRLRRTDAGASPAAGDADIDETMVKATA